MTGDHVEHLFARYWDGTLTPAESSELEALLRSDPAARDRFRLALLLSLTAGEAVDAAPLPGSLTAVPSEPPGRERSGRRQFLKYTAAGLAAGAVGVLAYRAARPAPAEGLVLVSVSGNVRLSGSQKAEVGAVVPPGTTVTTAGTDSSVTLALDESSTVILPGDSAVSLGDDGQLLTLDRGHLAADIRSATDRVKAFTFATDDAAFRIAAAGGSDAALVVGREGQHTDLAVERGRVLVNHPLSGQQLADAKRGDYVTVQAAGGRVTKESRRVIPDRFELDLAHPLPKAWAVGTRGDDGFLAPELWYDRYHAAELLQVRSHNEWTRGFAQLHPDSRVRVRYRVARPGPSQVCLCVRTLYATDTQHRTGMLDSVTAFEDARPGGWQWFDRRADQFLDHKETPKFPAPWVAFMLIVNTYDRDLGLEIAAFEITRPPVGGRV